MRYLLFAALAIWMHGCATQERVPAQAPTAKKAPYPYRHLAWMEGDFQTNYEPNRTIAEEKLKRWEGKIPEMTDNEEYLEYLSTLDASGRNSDAAAKIRQYIARFPNDKRAVFLLAAHYLRTGKKDLANYLFTQLEKDPQFQWKSLLYNNLAMVALQDKNRQAAIGYLEKAIDAKPASPTPLVNLGALYLQSHSYADAEKLFARARALDDDFEDAALGQGTALEGQGKYEEAHAVYAEFISDNPEALSVVYNDAVVLGSRLKRREEALPLMQRYIQRGGKETAKANEILRNWK